MIRRMQAVKVLIYLCLFRAKPQDLPYSVPLLVFVAATALVSSAIVLEPTAAELGRKLSRTIAVYPLAVAWVIALAWVIWLFLRLRLHTERFNQTASAVFGTSSLLNLAAWPIINWGRQAQESTARELPDMLLLVITFWWLAVTAHILKEALEVEYTVAALYTLGAWLLVSFGVVLGLLAAM